MHLQCQVDQIEFTVGVLNLCNCDPSAITALTDVFSDLTKAS